MRLSDFKLSDLKKAPPAKHGLSLVIAFDTIHKTVRFWRVFNLVFRDADVREFPFRESFLSAEFFAEFREICASYVAELPSNRQIACYLVMPDSMVTMDHISLPQMASKKREAALGAHLQNLYKNYKELQFNRYIASSNRQYVTYFLTVLKKIRLTELYRAMAENKLYSKITTFWGNCVVNGVLRFAPHYRRKNFLFFDLHADHTDVAICLKGRTAGFGCIMLGTNHLGAESVLQENMQYDHDVADLAILNAKEKARMKQLTVDEGSLDEVADDVIQQLAEGVNRNETDGQNAPETDGQSAPETEALAEIAAENAAAEQLDAEDAQEEEERRRNELAERLAESRKKKVFARKMPKRLPKFMLRPEPEDREGVVYENFRMFIKWALLYNKSLKAQEFMPALDCVLVNLPEEYGFVIDRANSEEEGNELPFELFRAEAGTGGYLGMIGALYAGVYNKRENF